MAQPYEVFTTEEHANAVPKAEPWMRDDVMYITLKRANGKTKMLYEGDDLNTAYYIIECDLGIEENKKRRLTRGIVADEPTQVTQERLEKILAEHGSGIITDLEH